MAYVPDLPRCVACGGTLEETEKLMKEAIAVLHLDAQGRRGDGAPGQTPLTVSPPARIRLHAGWGVFRHGMRPQRVMYIRGLSGRGLWC